jgi:hypothetical protein
MKSTTIGIAAALACLPAALLVPTAAIGAPTTLCKVNEEKCAEKNFFGGKVKGMVGGLGTSFPESHFKISLPETTVSCPNGKLGPLEFLETEGALEGPLRLWSSFTCEPSGCEVAIEARKEGYPASLTAIGKGNGSLLVNVKTLQVKCLSPSLTCTYSEAPIEFTVFGGNPGHIDSKAVLKLVSGFGSCGETATLDARYVLTVGPVFVTFR